MSKLKYIFKRIRNMNFGNFLKTVDDVHRKSGKSKIYIFFDAISCGFKYQAGYVDYQLFEMYKMNKEERKTIVTRGINNDIIKKYNNKEFFKYFNDKALFNEKFDKYLKREWIYLTEDNYEDFLKYLKGKKEIIIKPTVGSCGKGVDKIKVSDYEPKKLYDKLLTDNIRLVEDVAVQCKEIGKMHPTSINTVRVVTLAGKVVVAFLRMGNKGYVVDNFNHEGLVAPIDIKDGIIKYIAIDKQHNEYEIHPYTNEKIVGLQIPMWDKIVELCESACKEIPEIGYIGWDVCVGEKEPFLIEGNEFPGHDLYQLPPHRDGNTGLLPLFESVMEENK